MALWRRWTRWIYQDASEWKPGYWGAVPYLLYLRVLVVAGALLRFQLHPAGHSQPWIAAGLVIALATAFVLNWHSGNQIAYSIVVSLDIAVVSWGYMSTHDAKSDFFLFYFLPILTAAEFLGWRSVLLAFAGSSAVFMYVLFHMQQEPPYTIYPPDQLLPRVFLPRETFYVAVTLVWALRLQRERDSRHRSIRRQYQMKELLDCQAQLEKIFDMRDVLQLVVNRARADLRGRTAAGILYLHDKGHAEPIVCAAPSGEAADAEVVRRCEDAFGGHDIEGTAAITGMGHWVGAIAVRGLSPSDKLNSGEYLRSLAALTSVSYERARLLASFQEIGAATAVAVELNQTVESMLDLLVDELGFEYAIVSLVDRYMNRIRTVRGRNVPPGWIALSDHSLDSEDILPEIVRTRKHLVSDRYNKRFKFEIWDRYDHARYARIFVPLVVGEGDSEVVVGVLEAGCAKDKRTSILDPNEARVKDLGRRNGPLIARSLPSVLLELIATRAVELLGADSASLHVVRRGEEFLLAGAGKIDKEFLRRYPLSEDDIAREAIRTGEGKVEHNVPATSAAGAEGIRSMAAVPLELGSAVAGVLCVHYWRPHHFADAELESVKVFVRQMEVAIRNSLLLQDFSKIDEKAWMVTGLQNVIRSLGSNLNMEQLLKRIAADVQYMLDAKNLTLYEYSRQRKPPFSPAVTAGRFEHEGSMKMDVQSGSLVNQIVAEGQDYFIPDTAAVSFFRDSLSGAVAAPRFVDREGVKSCAILVLKSPYDGQTVGCLFANYDQPQDFDSEKKRSFKGLAKLLANSAAAAIVTARLHARDLESRESDIRRREAELDALRAIDRAIVADATALDMRKVSDIILDQALGVLSPNGDYTLADVAVRNESGGVLSLAAARGIPDWEHREFELDYGISGLAAATCRSILVPDVNEEPRYRQIHKETRSELAVPVVDVSEGSDRLLGVINIEHRNVNAFSERDKAFLRDSGGAHHDRAAHEASHRETAATGRPGARVERSSRQDSRQPVGSEFDTADDPDRRHSPPRGWASPGPSCSRCRPMGRN